MNNKFYWGLGILIVLLIGAFVFVMVKDQSKIRQLETDLAEAQKKREAHNKAANTLKVVDISDVKPPPAEPGFKWVRHGDHWDKIPVGQREKIVEPVIPTYTGPLTYHEELLNTNPVKALRLQAEERGHPSAEWIPPFPPDDLEAQAFARNAYLSVYLDEKDPKYYKAETAYLEKLRALSHAIFEEGQKSARNYDLLKIVWVLGSRPQSHYRGNVALFPSDYFPPIRDLK